MKKIIESYNIKSIFIGAILGIFIGIYIFSALVPSGQDMVNVYGMQKYKNLKNRNNTVTIDNKAK